MTPKVIEMEVYPVAGYDSPLLTLSGCHAPYFTRNIVILKDDSGNMGVGEIHGGEHTTNELNSYKKFVVGQEIANYRHVIRDIRKGRMRSTDDDGVGLQELNISNLKFVVQAEAAIECAMLDLLGKHLNMPIASLLGESGKQRDEVEFLGYMFYVADPSRIDLPYLKEDDSDDEWFRLRRTEMLTPDAIVEQARVLQKKYGFQNFKLKGGVLEGKEEMETIDALKRAFPEARINIDPNGAWKLEEAIKLCQDRGNVLTYVEDPCGPEQGFSSREITAEFKNATGLKVATNMIATNWRQFYHAASMKSVDIILADPHFWTLSGSIRMAYLLNDWGLTWGSHSNNHFDITLATFAQVSAAAPGNITPIDTHWIWQDGQSLLKEPIEIKDGKIKVDDTPGLGVEVDMDKIMEAHELYNSMPYRDRDDTIAMKYLQPDWKYDSKKPALAH